MIFCLRALSTGFVQGQRIKSRQIHRSAKFPQPPPIGPLFSEHESEARAWLTVFRTAATVPKHLVELSFSRSSGPGGQNVNKVSTKVTARCRVDATWIPVWARENLMQTPYYVKSTHSLLMTSSASRSQAANVDDVLAKLHTLVADSAESLIPKSPTEEQKARVVRLQKADTARRQIQKDKRSATKKSRSNKDWD